MEGFSNDRRFEKTASLNTYNDSKTIKAHGDQLVCSAFLKCVVNYVTGIVSFAYATD